uniref:WD repeat-containing protein 89 n=1 Tax=Timema shepardi TaxID=629360 RepID=A0A7R9AYW4_TIMSH|nr:unnamed protein product [Timema shepardi]
MLIHFPESQEYWVSFLLRIAYNSYSLHPVDEQARCDRLSFGLVGIKISKFVYDTDGTGQPKPLRSFDIACNDRFVSAGTELVDGDAFLLFWDARSSKLLGGYWESHREEITQVRFHPSKCDTVTTGSTDGLINIFDLSQGCEDDALLYSLNTEASVETLGWVTNDGAEDGLSCITQTEELQMWSIDGAAPNVHFTREDITKHIQNGMLVTGGESGLISLWKHSKSTLESSSSDRKVSASSEYGVGIVVTWAETDGEGDIDDDQATDWSSSDEDNENIDDKDENHRNDFFFYM